MLPRKFRLHRREEIIPVLRYGRPFPSSLITVRIRPNRAGNPRATVIVANAVSKKAVIRNRIRRRIQEVIRKEFLSSLPNIDVIISAKSPAVNASSHEFQKVLKEIFSPYSRSDDHRDLPKNSFSGS
ncbi:ribonuclease P protein component [Candidatus Uhrbacteria bacterium]|nr:ribonuclease P protein component [Candidatus Uhrbacteria bacterium]